MLAALAFAAAAVLARPDAPVIAPLPAGAAHGPALPLRIVGRGVVRREADGAPAFRRQWPGGYVDAAFRGAGAVFRVGTGEVILHVSVDGGAAATLMRPAPGLYGMGGLAAGLHRLRIQVVSESQAGPTDLGEVYAAPGGSAAALPAPTGRQIEFVGDSHTVGYGVASPTRTCTERQVWERTDTSLSAGADVAARYGADYEVDAISGRGVVRNYAGTAAPTLPEAYPYALLEPGARVAQAPGWRPQVVVVSLGTNDFSTPLHAGERWRDRAALHADYEAAYARFLRGLRARDPGALIVVWATDMADGEIAREAQRVVDALRVGGDAKVRFVAVAGLAFSACNAHPSVADDARVAAALERVIDAEPGVWARRDAAR